MSFLHSPATHIHGGEVVGVHLLHVELVEDVRGKLLARRVLLTEIQDLQVLITSFITSSSLRLKSIVLLREMQTTPGLDHPSFIIGNGGLPVHDWHNSKCTGRGTSGPDMSK